MVFALPSRADSPKSWQLFVWLNNGEKTGYLFADKPEFRLDGNVVKFQANGVSMDISKDDLDKFTMEQILPTDPIGITLPETFLLGLKRSAQLTYTLQPADAQSTVTWLNAAPDVVSVSSDGLLTGLHPGTSVVRAQTGNGLRAACLVTVPVPRYRLVVWIRDGSKSTVHDFADKPEITISGETFTVTSERKTVNYQATDIWKFTLEDSSLLTAGDVNGDATVDVADIATILSVMAGSAGVSSTNADVNCDGTVDVADIATVISIMAEK